MIVVTRILYYYYYYYYFRVLFNRPIFLELLQVGRVPQKRTLEN